MSSIRTKSTFSRGAAAKLAAAFRTTRTPKMRKRMTRSISSSLLRDLLPGRFYDRQKLLLLGIGHLQLVQRGFQVADAGVELCVGDVHAGVNALHLPAFIFRRPASGDGKKLSQVLLELCDILGTRLPFDRFPATQAHAT